MTDRAMIDRRASGDGTDEPSVADPDSGTSPSGVAGSVVTALAPSVPTATVTPGMTAPGMTAPGTESESAVRSTSAWPLRAAALIGTFALAFRPMLDGDWALSLLVAAACVYTLASWRLPLPSHNSPRLRMAIIVEQVAVCLGIVVTGMWSSPLVLLLVPTALLAGVAAGSGFSALASGGAVIGITAQEAAMRGLENSLRHGTAAGATLGAVAIASGLVFRTRQDAERQQQVALDRVSQLAEANSLLFSLQRVAQSLPTSLNLDEVLDSIVSRLRAMLRHDSIALYLVDGDGADLVRSIGSTRGDGFALRSLPMGLRAAVESPRPVRINDMVLGRGASPVARSGLYVALRARSSLVGLIAVEFNAAGGYREHQSEVVHGLSEPFGIAIDNARMFRGIRTLAADEERSRIARDLHDHIGSSLALIGFEIDRAMSLTDPDDEVAPALRELRNQVSNAIKDVRNTLFDLRTEVHRNRDLASTAAGFLEQVAQRSGLLTESRFSVGERMPMGVEREVWQIVREAIVNAERHADATKIEVIADETPFTVIVSVLDDGVGISATTPRSDSYGILGMGERARRLGATVEVLPRQGGGTEVRLTVPRNAEDPGLDPSLDPFTRPVSEEAPTP